MVAQNGPFRPQEDATRLRFRQAVRPWLVAKAKRRTDEQKATIDALKIAVDNARPSDMKDDEYTSIVANESIDLLDEKYEARQEKQRQKTGISPFSTEAV